MTWKVTEFEARKMLIQLTFETPLLISYDEPDTIIVTFADADLFISTAGI